MGTPIRATGLGTPHQRIRGTDRGATSRVGGSPTKWGRRTADVPRDNGCKYEGVIIAVKSVRAAAMLPAAMEQCSVDQLRYDNEHWRLVPTSERSFEMPTATNEMPQLID